MADEQLPTPNGQWKAGAKALHTFQQAAYAAGKTGLVKGFKGRPDRSFTSLKDVCKSIQDAAQGTGLSHTERWRPLGTDHAILTVTLHHDSGESISSELPVNITQKNREGSVEQAQGSAMTYARRYLLLGIYGLANDDEDDDGEATKTSSSATQPAPAAKPVSVPKSEQKSDAASADDLTSDEKDLCLSIIKDPDRGKDIKKQFMAKFYPSAEKLYPNMISTKEHLEFLDAVHTNVPF